MNSPKRPEAPHQLRAINRTFFVERHRRGAVTCRSWQSCECCGTRDNRCSRETARSGRASAASACRTVRTLPVLLLHRQRLGRAASAIGRPAVQHRASRSQFRHFRYLPKRPQLLHHPGVSHFRQTSSVGVSFSLIVFVYFSNCARSSLELVVELVQRVGPLELCLLRSRRALLPSAPCRSR